MNKEKAKSRIIYFDYLESISIFLVITLHASWLGPTIPASIATTIASSAVPIFFMIHGALLLERNMPPDQQVKRCIWNILQVESWNSIYLMVSVLLKGIKIKDITLGFLYRYYLCYSNISGNRIISNGHLWFVYALIVVYLLYPVLCACRDADKNLLKYIMCITFGFSIVLPQLNLYLGEVGKIFWGQPISFNWIKNTLNPFGMYANCVFFFIIGYILSQWLKDRKESDHSIKTLLASVVLFCIGVAFNMGDRFLEYGSFYFNWKQVPSQYTHIGTAIMAIGLFVCFSQIEWNKKKSHHFITYISLHTLDIYYIHALIIYLPIVRGTLKQICTGSVIGNSLRAFVALLLSLGIGFVIRKLPIIKRLLR